MCSHIAQRVKYFLTSHDVWMILHSPIVETSNPAIFSCFLHKGDIKSRHLGSPQVPLRAAKTAFKHLAGNKFQRIYDEWQRHWVKCALTNTTKAWLWILNSFENTDLKKNCSQSLLNSPCIVAGEPTSMRECQNPSTFNLVKYHHLHVKVQWTLKSAKTTY